MFCMELSVEERHQTVGHLLRAYRKACAEEKNQEERVERLDREAPGTRTERMILSAMQQNTAAALFAYKLVAGEDPPN